MHLPRLCRACACEVKDEACEVANNPAKPKLALLLKRYVPEFAINVENACLCVDCSSILYIFHNFKRKCLRIEEDLRLHLRKHPELKTVNLNKIFGQKQQESHVDSDVEKKSTIVLPSQTVATKTIQCEICSRTFSTKKILKSHKRKYHGRKRYQCNKCSRDFVSKLSYNSHIEYHKRPSAGRFKCTICNFVYQTFSGVDRHNIRKHWIDDQKPFQCKTCSKRFTEKPVLEAHQQTHNKIAAENSFVRFQEDVQEYKPLRVYASRRHFDSNKDKINSATVGNNIQLFSSETAIEEDTNESLSGRVSNSETSCDDAFFRPFLHEEKYKIKYEARKRYQCLNCSRDFFSENAYHEHLAYHKDPNAGSYTCNVCNFVYQTAAGLSKHNLYKHARDDQQPFQCGVCAKGFPDKYVLQQHMRTHKPPRKPCKYKCTLCNYATSAKAQLDTHVSANHNVRIICKLCERFFVSSKTLQIHEREFHGRTRYACDKCSRIFVIERAYNAHVAYHKKANADRFVCTVCNLVYHSFSGLEHHNVNKHLGDDQKPFQCEVCSKRFIENYVLEEHMRVHTGVKPLKCSLCTYATRQRNRMNMHIRLKH